MLLTFPDTAQDVVIYQDPNGLDWFHAGALCSILGFSNASDAVANHCPDASQTFAYQESKGRPSLFVSEYGLYMLVMASKKEIGTRFRRWIAYEVLPTIRKTGQYTATADDQQHFEPFGITLERKIAECDRAIAAASITTGEIGKIAASRKVLEKLYKENPKPRAKGEVENSLLGEFISAYRGQFGDELRTPKQMIEQADGPLLEVLNQICLRLRKTSPTLVGMFLVKHSGVEVDGWKIQKMSRTTAGRRWAVVKA